MTTTVERVAFRYRQAERVGDPKELLPLFVHAIAQVESRVSEDRIREAKATLTKWTSADVIVSFKDLAYDALFAFKHGQQKIAGPGHQLFLAILQTYALPPALRKKVEIASRLYMKEANPRIKNRSGFEAILERIQLWEKYRDLLHAHIDIAKEAIAKGKEHAEEGEGATKMKVGPFTLVNTGGFNGKVMDEVADVMQKVTAYAQSSGLGKVCYGEVQITNTIAKSRTLAFYLIAKDELFVRANVKATVDAVQTILHELGHRYQHKFMPGRDRDVEALYHLLSRQEIKHKYDRTKAKEKLPKPGEKLVSKGKTYVVKQSLPDYKTGYKVYLEREDDPRATATISLDGWLSMKGVAHRDIDADPNYIGFVTDYAKKGGAGENFAEMFSYYCMGRLPVLQSVPFENLVFGGKAAARRVAARYRRARDFRQLHVPAVYIPSQTNIGFSVFVPTPKDADDLERLLSHSRLLGRGRMRTQKSYMLEAVELHWMPTGDMPTLREFTHEVEVWARRHGYTLARDMRQLRQGLDALRS